MSISIKIFTAILTQFYDISLFFKVITKVLIIKIRKIDKDEPFSEST